MTTTPLPMPVPARRRTRIPRPAVPPGKPAQRRSGLGWRSVLVGVFLVGLLALPTHRANGQDEYPLEAADTSSPRATLNSFIDACKTAYEQSRRFRARGDTTAKGQATVDRALRCLDLSQLAPSLRRDAGKEAAVCLKEVLDRIELPPNGQIPDAAGVQTEKLQRWSIPHTEITIARVQEGARAGQWLFSPDTVDRATDFFQRVRRLPYKPGATVGFYERFRSAPGWMIPTRWIQSLPSWARTRIYHVAVWQWVGLAATLVLGLLVMLFAYRAGRRLAPYRRQASVVGYCLTLLFPIAAMLVPLLGKYFVAKQLAISGPVLAVTTVAADVVFLLALIIVLVGAGNRIAELIIATPKIQPRGIDAQLIRLVSRVLSLIAATVVFLAGGQHLGVPLATLLAGAGVGGLAVALAAQDTLRNLFGSVMIMLDKPYRVGERIVAKGYDGIVEEIGLRSTKMRLLTGHTASIPNEEMARSDIENIGRRRHIRRITNIGIPLDTPPDQVEQAVQIVRGILADHEGMRPEFPPRVYLNELNRDSINLRFIYWYHPPNYWDFLALSEKVNLRIMRQFKTAGIRFALPSTTTFMAQNDESPLQLEIVGAERAGTNHPRP